MKITVLRGISGSGKSTTARTIKENSERCIIINRDSIRAMLFGSEDAYGVDEELVTKVEHHTLDQAIRRGYDVVSDNTNISVAFAQTLINLARFANPDIEVEVVFIDTSLEESIRRNNLRERQVPEHVIRTQYTNIQKTKDWTHD